MSDFEETQEKVRQCIRLGRNVQRAGDRLIADCGESEDPAVVGTGLKEFNERFAAFKLELDALGITDIDTRPELNPEAPGSAVGELVDTIKSLLDTHQKIIGLVQEVGGQTSERLGVIRQARDIFQKFVRPKDDKQPRFFDKKG